MIDLKSPLLTNPESLQTPYNLTGIKPGERWRQASGLHRGYLPAIVRFLRSDEKDRELRVFGSGTVIGCVQDRWLIVATAGHILHGLGPHRPEPFPGLETEEERANRRFPPGALASIRAGVTIWEQQREVYCEIVGAEISEEPHLRDTALVFARLPEGATGKAQLMKVDVGPPPFQQFPLLTGGFAEPGADETQGTAANGFSVYPRKLILREGFSGGFGPSGGGPLWYDVVKIHIPVAPGMSGGPVIIHRPDPPFRTEPVVVAINNTERELSREVSTEPESFATPTIALWRHDVALPPDRTWISFKEAVGRGYIATSGAGPHHVVERDGRLVVDAA